jgi:hypothetical protein
MQNQQLFETPFISEFGANSCSKCAGMGAGKCMCKRCQGEAPPSFRLISRSKPGCEAQWLFESPFHRQIPHSSISTQESYMDAMVVPFQSRSLSPIDIAKLTIQIEDRMKALGIPGKYIGIKGIPGANGRGFDSNMADPGGNVRTRGIAVGNGVLNSIPGWSAWNKASLKTRIDAVIAHEWAEFKRRSHDLNKAHSKARDLAPETKLPISEAARRLLLNQKNRGTPEVAYERLL